MTEVGNDVLCARVIPDAGGRVAAEIDDRGGQVELLGVPGDVPIAPRDAAAAPEVAGIGSIEADAMARPLAHLERHGHPAALVGRLPDLHADRREDAEPEQILARFFDVARAERIAGMNKE